MSTERKPRVWSLQNVYFQTWSGGEMYQQDRFLHCQLDCRDGFKVELFLVLDGHGTSTAAVDFVEKHLPTQLVKVVNTKLEENGGIIAETELLAGWQACIVELDGVYGREMKSSDPAPGTTITGLVLANNGKQSVGGFVNLGDSRTVASTTSWTDALLKPSFATSDHTPAKVLSDPRFVIRRQHKKNNTKPVLFVRDLKALPLSASVPNDVYDVPVDDAFIGVGRVFGDHHTVVKEFLSNVADVTPLDEVVGKEEEKQQQHDEMHILLASDGFWDIFDMLQADEKYVQWCEIMCKALETGGVDELMKTVKHLVSVSCGGEAWDNVTFAVCQLVRAQ